jgi:hypothetical protein
LEERLTATDVVKAQTNEIEIAEERIPFVYQAEDGSAFRALVERKQAKRFFRDLTKRIDEKRDASRLQIEKDVAALFDTVFEDKNEAVSAYADWFYEWGRTYKLVAEALIVSMRELGGSALSSIWNMELRIDPDRALSVAERSIQDNLMESYARIVLRPQHRDAQIEAGVHEIARKAYGRFLNDMDDFNLELVEFLYAQDPNAQSIDATEIVLVDLSWDTAKFDAPRDRSSQVISSAAVSATVLLGSTVFSAEISAVLVPVLSTIGGELLATVGFAAGGGVLGSEVPVLGNIAGILVGLSADYVINAFRENMTREEFEAETQRGLEVTILRWKGKIAPSLHQVNDSWYADVRRILLPPEIINITHTKG